MSEGIPYADIVIIALIAGFILLRLRSVLGEKTGEENPDLFMRPRQENQPDDKEKIIQLHEKAIKPKMAEPEDAYLDALKEETAKEGLKQIKQKDASFNATQFVAGAKGAFEMVFDAFAKGEKEPLKMLLSDSIYETFASEIDKRDAQENKEETTLVSVPKQEITEARLIGKKARITVNFLSEQITIVRGPDGKIVEGDASSTEEVENEWVFERDVTSKNPNWTIIET